MGRGRLSERRPGGLGYPCGLVGDHQRRLRHLGLFPERLLGGCELLVRLRRLGVGGLDRLLGGGHLGLAVFDILLADGRIDLGQAELLGDPHVSLPLGCHRPVGDVPELDARHGADRRQPCAIGFERHATQRPPMGELADDRAPLDIPKAHRPVGAPSEEVAGEGGGVGQRRHRTGPGVQFLDRLRRCGNRIDRRRGERKGKGADDAVGFGHGQLRPDGGYREGTDAGRPHEPPRHVPIGRVGGHDAAVNAGRVNRGPVGRKGQCGDGGSVRLERPTQSTARGIDENDRAVRAAAGGTTRRGGHGGDPGSLRHLGEARGAGPLPQLDGAERARGEQVIVGGDGQRQDRVTMGTVGGGRGVGRGRVDKRPQKGAGAAVIDAQTPAAGRGGDAAIVAHRDGEDSAGAGGDRPPVDRFLRDRRAGGSPLVDPTLEESELYGAHRLRPDLVFRRRHEVLLEVGRAEEDGALRRLAGDHARAGIAPRQDPLEGVEDQPPLMDLGVVAGGAVGGKEREDLVLETDGVGPFRRRDRQAVGKTGHGAEQGRDGNRQQARDDGAETVDAHRKPLSSFDSCANPKADPHPDVWARLAPRPSPSQASALKAHGASTTTGTLRSVTTSRS